VSTDADIARFSLGVIILTGIFIVYLAWTWLRSRTAREAEQLDTAQRRRIRHDIERTPRT
jgi:threonine/homoserine/homoserine lactone efflux protein